MATTGAIDTNLLNSLNGTSSSSTAATTTSTAKKNNEIGKDQFLTLLITQLKNQDPLDPMKNDQFAVDMAQFSQVEQLVSINENLKKSGSGDLGSLASYLGREVVTGADQISVSGGDGGRLKVTVPSDAASGKLDLLDANGAIKESFTLGELKKGENTIQLSDLTSADGDYSFKVTTNSSLGGEITNKAEVAGVVSGFIPGADPKLIVGTNKQISPSDIVRVGVA